MPVHSVQRLQRLQKMTENEWRPNFLADEGEVDEDPEDIFCPLEGGPPFPKYIK